MQEKLQTNGDWPKYQKINKQIKTNPQKTDQEQVFNLLTVLQFDGKTNLCKAKSYSKAGVVSNFVVRDGAEVEW